MEIQNKISRHAAMNSLLIFLAPLIFVYHNNFYVKNKLIHRAKRQRHHCLFHPLKMPLWKGCHSESNGNMRHDTCICGALRDLVQFVQFKKREKHPWRSVNFSKLQASPCNFTKINTPPWVFFTFFKLYKWYQIAQHTTFVNGNCIWRYI